MGSCVSIVMKKKMGETGFDEMHLCGKTLFFAFKPHPIKSDARI
jgi:hypothetical protein